MPERQIACFLLLHLPRPCQQVLLQQLLHVVVFVQEPV
jgi:hypothetical protein